ncbi:MAG: DNA mismatch repair protein [Marteilia pararefringens]
MINESIICDKVCGYISSLILSHSRSRTFNASSRPKTLQFQPLVENYSKSLNSIDDNHIEVRNSLLSVDSVEKSHSFSALNDEQSHSTLPSNASYYQSDRFISRNSPKAIKIENFAKKSSSCVQDGPSNNNDLSQIATVTKNYEACDKNEPINSSNSGLKIETINLPQKVDDSELTSIKELKARWKIDICDKIINTLIDSTFVGTVSESQILIQHQTTLLLMDFQSCFQEFIYQNIIMTFSKLPKIQIENPLDLDALILLGLELPENGYSEDSRDLDKNITSFAKKTLISNKDMLSDFFSIDIDAEKECLTSFPQVHPRIHPPFAFLPSFLLKIVAEIDWCDEKECIKGLALSLSEFFSLPDPQVSEDEKYNRIGYYFQHLILNTVKDQSYRSRFMPSMALRNIFKPIVNLQDMYKIFERC